MIRKFGIIRINVDGSSEFLDVNNEGTQDESLALKFDDDNLAGDYLTNLVGTFQLKEFREEG